MLKRFEAHRSMKFRALALGNASWDELVSNEDSIFPFLAFQYDKIGASSPLCQACYRSAID